MADRTIERKYEEVFQWVCDYVDRQRQNNSGFTIQQLKKMLETEYVNQGNGWSGKSDIQETVSSATIAAYQHKIVEWQKETKQTEGL
ncbi:MAG: hypothetical protein K9J27_01170 [Bacteroidales bacterium]|nr:hypothetical protein [Bacteroidales bacterium]MCF8334238.1 hypothetical protein [Bacteroidales bacterium]